MGRDAAPSGGSGGRPSRPGDRPRALALLAILVLVVGAASVGGYFIYRAEIRDARRTAQDHLDAVADLKTGQIADWLAERFGDADVAARDPFAAPRLSALVAGGGTPQDERDAAEWLAVRQQRYDYDAVYLCDQQGRARLRRPADAADPDQVASSIISEAVRAGAPRMADIHSNARGDIHVGIAVPVEESSPSADRPPARLLFVIDPNRFLFPLVQSWPEPSETAETLLVRREGDEVVYLNELRHRRGAALSIRLPISSPDLPAARLLREGTKSGEGLDYRGVPVIFAARRIPGSDWAIVAKIDQVEAYAGARRRGVFVLVALAAVLLAMALVAALVWRSWRANADRAATRAATERATLAHRFETLVEQANDALVVADADRHIVAVNGRACTLYGYTRDEFAGLSITDLRAPDRREDLPGMLHHIRDAGGAVVETTHVRKDGTELAVEVSARMVDLDGVPHFQALVRDVSERKQHERERQRAAAELERLVHERTADLAASNQELEAFAHSVSHDLRAPLRAMHGFAQALIEDSGERLDPQGRDFARRIQSAGSRMASLIDDLLALSRVTRADRAIVPVDLTALTHEVVGELRRGDRERRVEVRVAGGLVADGDPRLLRVLLVNLLGNAWKFTSRRAEATIEFGAEDLDGERVFVVRDDGVGFDMEYADRLFEPFQRLHSSADFPGTGIGLATAQRVVLRHGGRIWAQAAVDKGAAFRFTLNTARG
ncbi:MAG: PAS domain S-box protein [Deltaproteobacteria bacterium]|nr:PAS domain S-box protein [Deltaproteobacteria bacterium]